MKNRLWLVALISALCACNNRGGGMTPDAAWGAKGDGRFLYIEDLAFTKDGRMLVTDALRADVQVFGADGKFLGKIGKGPGDLFEKPEGVAVAPDGSVFVGDYITGLVTKLDKDFKRVKVFGGNGRGKGQLREAEFMSIAGDRLYIAEAGNDRISVFDLEGNFRSSFGKSGSAPGELRRPEEVEVGPDGLLYVADYGNHRVQIFDKDGRFLRSLGKEGGAPGEFRNPTGIEVDEKGNLYVCDSGNGRIQVFGPDGRLRRVWGREGSAAGEFGNLHGIEVRGGHVYIADTANYRVQRLKIW